MFEIVFIAASLRLSSSGVVQFTAAGKLMVPGSSHVKLGFSIIDHQNTNMFTTMFVNGICEHVRTLADMFRSRMIANMVANILRTCKAANYPKRKVNTHFKPNCYPNSEYELDNMNLI